MDKLINFFYNFFKELNYLPNIINNGFKGDLENFDDLKLYEKTKKNLDEEAKLFKSYKNMDLKNKFNFLRNDNLFFLDSDFIWIYLFSRKYKLNNINLFRSNFRVLSGDKGFYFNFLKLKNQLYLKNYFLNTFYSAYKFIWKGIKFWIFPLIVLFSVIYFTLVLRSLPFNKILFSWICVLMFVYWLISGFVFFIKKYQFGKYTTAVQRFWRRSYILFWMIEGGTFLVFMFFTFNSSQESFYMYDQINVFKTHLYSWKYFLLKLFPIVILIISTYLIMLSLKWNIYSKNSIILLILTFLLSYMVWIEFYQFFHVVNFYGNLNWIYDIDEHVWTLELEPRRTRIVNHYVMLLFILKFWHIIFIYGFWIFFVLRCWETKRIRYPLLSANFQNFIILYIFAWVFMYPWVKFYLRKFLDISYYWFYINNRKVFFRIFFNDIKLIFYGLFNYLNNLNIFKFNNFSFYYWKLNLSNNNYDSYRKFIIRDRVIQNLIN